MTDERPMLDYWMLEIVEKGVKSLIGKYSSGYPSGHVVQSLEERNEWDKFGQLQSILDRLNEMRVGFDKEVKDILADRRKSND